MSNSSEIYPEAELLSVANVQIWDLYIQEKVVAYQYLGKAIRTNVKYVINPPGVHDMVPGTLIRKYKLNAFNPDELVAKSEDIFRDDLQRYEKLHDRRGTE